MFQLLTKIFGSKNEREIKKILPIIEHINSLEPQFEKLSNEELKEKIKEFKSRIAESAQVSSDSEKEALDNILPEVFAIVREAGKRTLKQRHFDVQHMGGIVLHHGRIAEMRTGEGKTLVSSLPLVLNSITGKGCHLVTPNDYLSRVGGGWMGPIYNLLGISVGVITHEFAGIYDPSYRDSVEHGDDRLMHWSPCERREAYKADITYGTNNEFGFDYLRDNMVVDVSEKVQREYNFAIVDEVDSILIDEARTPLIISGPAEESTDKYYKIDKIIPYLKQDADYKIEEKTKTVALTEEGVAKVEKILNIPNLYDPTYIELIHHVSQALKAHTLFKKDVDYIIKDGEVIIVDEFTGRLMPGRRYSDGLHQALEAKENVKIARENQTLATVTFQNYFRMYKKLAGMTGTAETEASEFMHIYKLDVIAIPTNKAMVRVDYPDGIYKTRKEKLNAIVNEIAEKNKKGQPVLVGTISIERNEELSRLLRQKGVKHQVLNAKFHEMEAEIISKAGQPGAVTVATNMAGRGVDIILGQGVAEVGGLHVIGTERHEARRIDNQLRGRAGRQGDPGSSLFYLSLEDDLMRIFGSDRISVLMDRLGMEEGQEISHPMVSRAIERAQRTVEGHNFEIRKHLLEYDDVMNKQREVIYSQRAKVFNEKESLKEQVFKMIEDVLEIKLDVYAPEKIYPEMWNLQELKEWAYVTFGIDISSLIENPQALKRDEFIPLLFETLKEAYGQKENSIGTEMLRYLERVIMLQVIDSKWKDHLYAMDQLKEGIGLRAYGQKDPLVEYKREGYEMFVDMIMRIKEEVVVFLFKVQPAKKEDSSLAFTARRPSRVEFQHTRNEQFDKISSASNKETGGNNMSKLSSILSARSERLQPVIKGSPQVGRNDPCPCGSNKKYKKCCGK